MNKHDTTYTNDNSNAIKISKPVSFNDNNYLTKKMEHASNITNNITRHDNNNCEIM